MGLSGISGREESTLALPRACGGEEEEAGVLGSLAELESA